MSGAKPEKKEPDSPNMEGVRDLSLRTFILANVIKFYRDNNKHPTQGNMSWIGQQAVQDAFQVIDKVRGKDWNLETATNVARETFERAIKIIS